MVLAALGTRGFIHLVGDCSATGFSPMLLGSRASLKVGGREMPGSVITRATFRPRHIADRPYNSPAIRMMRSVFDHTNRAVKFHCDDVEIAITIEVSKRGGAIESGFSKPS